jgi:hypothetical protein
LGRIHFQVFRVSRGREEGTVSDILARRENHFVLWCPAPPANPPELIVGQIRNGNPPTFQQIARQAMQQAMNTNGAIEGLWHLKAGTLGLAEGKTYHFWFEVGNTLTGHAGRVQTTDPLAFSVDYRLYPLANPSIVHPASANNPIT